jgi:hypothetical protein
MMTAVLIGVLVWGLCAWGGYLLYRWWWTDTLAWTVEDRREAIIESLALGPIGLVVGLVAASGGLSVEPRTKDPDKVLRPARTKKPAA